MSNIGKRIHRLTSCHSTNDVALTYLGDKEAHQGDVIWTIDQTAGRGQRGNVWESNPKENLTASFILMPDYLLASQQFRLTQFVSLSIVTLLKLAGIEAKIKWPNDIYVGTRKIAGVLIENKLKGNRVAASVIGIGLNVNQSMFNEAKATSMRMVTQQEFVIEKVLENLVSEMNDYYQTLISEDELKEAYMSCLLGKEEALVYDDGDIFESKVVDVLETGHLVLSKNGLIKQYALKEVRLIMS